MRSRVAAVLCSLSSLCIWGCHAHIPPPPNLDEYLSDWDASSLRSVGRPQAGITPAPPSRPPGSASKSSLDVNEAVALALVSNPQARALRLDAGAVELGAEYAGAWTNPILSAEVRRAAASGSSPWVVSAGIGFTVPLSGRHASQRAGAWARASVARLQAMSFELDLADAVRSGWLDWSQAARRVELLGTHLDSLRPLVALAQRLADSGELSVSELQVLPLEEAEARLDLHAAGSDEERARLRLLALLGLAPDTPVTFARDLSSSGDVGSRPSGWPQQHVRVRLALAGIEVATHGLRLALRTRAPELVIGPTFEADRGSVSGGIVLSIPIPSFDRNREAVAEGHGRRAALEARAQRVAEDLAAQEHQTRAEIRALDHRLEGLRALQVGVDAHRAAIEQLSHAGELDVLLLRHALGRTLAVRLRIARAERDIGAARFALRSLYHAVDNTPGVPR